MNLSTIYLLTGLYFVAGIVAMISYLEQKEKDTSKGYMFATIVFVAAVIFHWIKC